MRGQLAQPESAGLVQVFTFIIIIMIKVKRLHASYFRLFALLSRRSIKPD